MRLEEFTMERDVLNVGDEVAVSEWRLPFAYYYTAEPAAAMSGNYEPLNRIESSTGIVREKEKKDDGSYIIMIEFEK